jgi:tRNA-specific 2-thiouridylase
MRKDEVRIIAAEQNFINAGKKDSQDICFVPDGDYAAFIEHYTGRAYDPGRFIDTLGKDMGPHRGIIHYTIGQRKGLGLALPHPGYVCEIRPQDNTVVVGSSESVFSKRLTASDINWIACDRLDEPVRAGVKIRYQHQEHPATVRQTDDDTVLVEFDTPQRAVTKGQAVVFYDGDIILGGGTIV